jgi:hypothetical protein
MMCILSCQEICYKDMYLVRKVMYHMMMCTHCISRELYLKIFSGSSLYSYRGFVNNIIQEC